MLTSANPNPKIIKKFKIQTLSETARLQLPTFGTGFVSDSKVIFVKNFSAPLCKCNAEKVRTENDCMICKLLKFFFYDLREKTHRKVCTKISNGHIWNDI